MAHVGQNGLIALAPAEQAELAQARGDRKIHLFFSLWTMKEALIKALGTGFSLYPPRFGIPPPLRRDQRTGVFRFPHDPATRCRLENIGNASFAAAVACESGPVNPAEGHRG